MPQSIRRLGLLWSRMPARLADSSPGALTVDSGGNNSHKRPVRDHPDELESRQGYEGDPHRHQRPAEMPGQSGADSA